MSEALKGEYLSAAQLLLIVPAYAGSIAAARRRKIDVHWRFDACVVLLLLPAGLARTLGLLVRRTASNQSGGLQPDIAECAGAP
jgi:hypothetical protein